MPFLLGSSVLRGHSSAQCSSFFFARSTTFCFARPPTNDLAACSVLMACRRWAPVDGERPRLSLRLPPRPLLLGEIEALDVLVAAASRPPPLERRRRLFPRRGGLDVLVVAASRPLERRRPLLRCRCIARGGAK